MDNCYPLAPIATVNSPFREKFATPRQPGLTPSVRAIIEFFPRFAPAEALRGLEDFSHLWLIFLFHHNWHQGWSPTVRPPRLGGNRRVGVYASRSPFRPNPIGLSVVKLLELSHSGSQAQLEVEGADLIDGTPILDVKPFLPDNDCPAGAHGGYTQRHALAPLKVIWTPEAKAELEKFSLRTPDLHRMVEETLRLDPRPAYRRRLQTDRQEYGMHLADYNIRWRMSSGSALVFSLKVVS